MVKHLHLKGIVALAAAFATSMSAFAATQITDAAGLAAIGNDLAGEYELANDITLTGEWTPVGTDGAPFTGKFNGNGHAITGLYYNNGSGNWVGLFGQVTGTVENVRIEGANIYGNEHVGILAGRVFGGGKVSGVYASGYVNGRDHTGGIVGDAGETDSQATVENCMSLAYVISRDYQAGGIVGWTKGTVSVTNNFFMGEAYCGGWAGVGGIVGFVEDGTTTVKGNVSAARKLTGAAYNSELQAQRQSQGIVGSTYNDNSILVASNNLVSSATVIINRDNGEPVDQSTLSVDFNGVITPAADLKNAATYTALGWGAAWNLTTGTYPVLAGMTVPVNGDFIHTNTIPAEVYTGNTLDLTPVSTAGFEVSIATNDAAVASVEGTVVTFKAAGTATITLTTAGDSFIKGSTLTLVFNPKEMDTNIATAADLDKLRENPQGNFKLTADIDMSEVEFTPINFFSGSLDGQGHYIRNLTFINKDRNRVGLFAEFGGTFVKNLGFENLNFIGHADVAALAGKTTSASVISGIVVSNSKIQGQDHSASIVGNIDGGATVTNCISNAEITSRDYQAGGIAGVLNYGTIDKVIFCGTVGADRQTCTGGIVALLDSDSNPSAIKNCLAAAVTYRNGGNSAELIIGRAGRKMTLENNYVTTYSTWSGVPVSPGAADSDSGAAATEENVRSQAWYSETLGFDFTADWKFLAGGEGQMLPVLAWMNAPLETVVFNLPNEDGRLITFTDGSENWNYGNDLRGSWGQSVDLKQLNGFEYATLDGTVIYPGDSDYNLPATAGSAEFELEFAPAIADLFTLEGRKTIKVNVAPSNAEIEVATVEDFLKISRNPAAKYTLTADIDLAGVEFEGFFNEGDNAFSGTLNGAGHSVKNFTIKFTEGNDKGLFGKTANANIKNIAFVDFVIDGGTTANHVGIIGQGSAVIENVAFIGMVYGDDHVGLVAGDADGIEIKNSYAFGGVKGRSQVGGFFGCTLEGGCKVENCLSNVNAASTSRGWTGGYIGLIDKANSEVTIINSVSIGNCSTTGDGTPKVTAPFIAGNNAGEGANAKIIFTGNIYNSAATMDAETEWPGKNETLEGGVVEAATAQNPNTLQMEATYTALGWDFEKVWTMGKGEYKYPVLQICGVSDETLNGVDDVVAAPADAVKVAAANGEITVSGLGETSVIAVYTAAGVQVANVAVSAPEAVVALPAAGLYIVSVATDGDLTTAKVVVK